MMDIGWQAEVDEMDDNGLEWTTLAGAGGVPVHQLPPDTAVVGIVAALRWEADKRWAVDSVSP